MRTQDFKQAIRSLISTKSVLSYFLILQIVLNSSCSSPGIYVATYGNDQNPGSKSKPLATIEKAIEMSRTGVSKNIIIRQGKYYNVSCTITDADSGLTISGEQDRDVFLFGGKKITGWRNEGEWFVADAPGTRDRAWDFRILIVNDSLRQRARLPENGFFQHQSNWPHEWQSSQGGWSKKPTEEDLTTMVYNPGDIGSWLDTRNAELTVFHAWDDSYVGLKSIDTVNNKVVFSYPATHPAGAFGSWGGRTRSYIIWNIREGMKHPGQWYLDRSAEKIYYWPHSYEKIDNIEALAPTKNQVFTFSNGAANIIIGNLKISCANAPMSNTGYGTSQIRGAIEGTGVKNLSLNNVSVKNVAGWAMKIRGTGLRISDGEFSYTGAGGINYHGNNIKLERCGINNVGKLFFGAVGINGGGKNNLVSHCELFNIPYAAINGLGKNSLAEYNLIYNFKLELTDGGAIYCYGGDSTIYRNNAALFANDNNIVGWTYYFDELSKNCIMENNLAVNSLAPVHNHMATEIIVRNNLFIDQGKQEINSFLCSDVHFIHNTFVADTIVFSTPIGEALSKSKESYNPVYQNYYNANGNTELIENALYCDKIFREVMHMYDHVRTEIFDPAGNTHLTDKNQRELFRSSVPKSFFQTGYRGNFETIFRRMTIKE